MTYASPTSAVANDNVEPLLPAEADTHRAVSRWVMPLEVISALLMAVIIALLLGGVVSRYAFGNPIVWIDEAVSIAFIWVAMVGAAIAMHRNEHLRLTLFLDMLPPRARDFVHALALVGIVAFLVAMVHPAYEFAQEEWFVTSPTLEISNTFRVAALLFGIVAMLAIVLVMRRARCRSRTCSLPPWWWPRWPRCAAGCRRSSRNWA